MAKNFIKKILYKMNIYNLSRKIIVRFYYPYKNYIIRKNATIILSKLNKVFSKKTKLYWLDYGTLLGYVREKKIIKGDLDLDFGVISNESLKDVLSQENIFLTQQTVVDGIITMEQYNYKNIGFDIFYYRKTNNRLVTYIWLANDYTIPQKESYKKGEGKLYETVFSSFKPKEIEFYTISFLIPNNYDLYLKEHFGDDYMIPNPNFSHNDEKNKKVSSKEFKVLFYE